MQYTLSFRMTVCVRARARGSALRHFAAVMITVSLDVEWYITIRFWVTAVGCPAYQQEHPSSLGAPAACRRQRCSVLYRNKSLHIFRSPSDIILNQLMVLCVWQPQAKSILFFLWHFILILLFQRARNLRLIEQTIISLPGHHSFSTLSIALCSSNNMSRFEEVSAVIPKTNLFQSSGVKAGR